MGTANQLQSIAVHAYQAGPGFQVCMWNRRCFKSVFHPQDNPGFYRLPIAASGLKSVGDVINAKVVNRYRRCQCIIDRDGVGKHLVFDPECLDATHQRLPVSRGYRRNAVTRITGYRRQYRFIRVNVTQADPFEIFGCEYRQYTRNRQRGATVDSFDKGMGMGASDNLGKHSGLGDDIGCISGSGQGSLSE